MASGFLVLISFFTRIPIGKFVRYDENNFKKALCLYPLLGVLVGAFLVFGYYLGTVIKIQLIKGLIITVFYIIITGGIHLDGTSDTTDGLFSGRTGDRIFEIMSDSRVGSFGVISLILVLVFQIILFSYLPVHVIFLTPIIGRASVVVSCYKRNYAKKNKGMGTLFIENIKLKELCFSIITVIIVCMLLKNNLINIITSLITLLSARIIGNWIVSKVNGMTGDTCGFVNETTQITFMLVYLLIEGIILV